MFYYNNSCHSIIIIVVVITVVGPTSLAFCSDPQTHVKFIMEILTEVGSVKTRSFPWTLFCRHTRVLYLQEETHH